MAAALPSPSPEATTSLDPEPVARSVVEEGDAEEVSEDAVEVR